MALAIDGSTPAVVRNANATTTTASFSPPAGSALVAFIHSDANNGSTESCTVTSTGGLSWTRAIQHNGSPGANCEIWWAFAASAPGSITVSVTDSQGSVDKSLDVVVFTGADPAVIGQTNSGTGLFLNITTSKDNSWCWYAALGSMTTTTPIDSGSTIYDLVDNGGFDGGDSIVTVRHTTTTPTSGTLVTTGIAVGAGAALHAVAVEILASSAVSTGQQSTNRHPGKGPGKARFFRAPGAFTATGNVVNIDGSLTVTANRSATIAITHTVGGSLTVTANRTATVAVTHTIGGSLTVTANRTATVAVTHTIGGTRVTTVNRTATIAITHTVAGSRPITVGLSATVAVTHVVSGTRPITVGLTASIITGKDISGSRPTTVNRTASIAVTHAIGGSLSVVCVRSADAATGGGFAQFLPFF